MPSKHNPRPMFCTVAKTSSCTDVQKYKDDPMEDHYSYNACDAGCATTDPKWNLGECDVREAGPPTPGETPEKELSKEKCLETSKTMGKVTAVQWNASGSPDEQCQFYYGDVRRVTLQLGNSVHTSECIVLTTPAYPEGTYYATRSSGVSRDKEGNILKSEDRSEKVMFEEAKKYAADNRIAFPYEEKAPAPSPTPEEPAPAPEPAAL